MPVAYGMVAAFALALAIKGPARSGLPDESPAPAQAGSVRVRASTGFRDSRVLG
jgi:hypothetical protein